MAQPELADQIAETPPLSEADAIVAGDLANKALTSRVSSVAMVEHCSWPASAAAAGLGPDVFAFPDEGTPCMQKMRCSREQTVLEVRVPTTTGVREVVAEPDHPSSRSHMMKAARWRTLTRMGQIPRPCQQR